jgi:hypothetical protein
MTTLGATSPVTDGLALLTYTAFGGSAEVVDYAIPDSTGHYNFSNVGSIFASDQYTLWYLNDGTLNPPTHLSLWYGTTSSFSDGQNSIYNFDIGDQKLTSPPHEAEKAFPVTFTWPVRTGVTGVDRYYLCVYDIDKAGSDSSYERCSGRLTTNTYQITSTTQLNMPDFQYGKRYAWYIIVDNSIELGYGYAYYANAIKFAQTAPPPPPSGGTPDNTSVSASGAGDAWLMMVYIAGDNNLGDPNRYPNPTANLQGQWAMLKQLAQTYPNVTLFTLTDFYDNTGTKFCHLKSDGTPPLCQQLGEKDTSNPATLTYFITKTLSVVSPLPLRKMLVISDHGHSIAGVAADETTSPTAVMAPDQIRQALSDAGLGSNKLDILFYNVCLMGSLEAAFDASPFANYMVASSNEVWVMSVYERVLPLLNNAGNTPRNVAIGIVDAYSQTITANAPSYFISSAAYDLSKTPVVTQSVSLLATALSNNLGLARSGIDSALNQAQRYDSSGNNGLGSEDAFVDLRHLATRLSNTGIVNNTAINTAASSVLTALNSGFVIASAQKTGGDGQGHNHVLANAYGLSIYFPNGNNTGGQPTLTNMYLNVSVYQTYINQTKWDEFLRAYLTGNVASGPAGFELGTRPISGLFSGSGSTFLPLIRR